ncbi:protein MpLOX2 [Marchantia polymorpha subsp. ruderalis]|uniref:Lipoxygenase n=2 Tax=Marchantia polymorpha TaxID=3197 RepID=A0A176W5K5_MARPO|nr:hypothetical protein AXG93_2507s1220 [Marchantia polymorpha subsp. ruderalis]PTQ27600.1 hypothetical protein MARPO_0191s0014 [Marchantia polymorpha]BAJ46515.1 lipoxygenase [Marchantia polymorpha]BBN03422.1 hypothetical protein Mp_2g23380 [Marchantia polymorpha subsp. ruderalis]|eukprot:PTQ27600.1 hypothetical protein MARPO_0191s0014 [Marchantia polymorpha]
MDLSTVSRLQSSLAASTGPIASSCTQALAAGRPSTVKTQKLGLKFSSLSGKSIKDAAGVSSRRVKCSAEGSKTGFKVRAEQINVSTNAISTLQRTVPVVDQEIVTLKGKVILKRSKTNSEPTTPFADFQKLVWFTLVSTELDEQANLKKSARTQMQVDGSHCVGGIEVCEIAFSVECDFGEPGALIVESRSGEEFFLQSAELSSADSSELYQFPCNSWINQKSEENYKLVATKDQFRSHFLNEVIHRIFFTNKVYLPKDTPSGLQKLRSFEMATLRGNGTGERKHHDRIYEYDVYNDLGDAEANILRPTLGGPGNIPYPRRCRTGRKVDEKTGMEVRPARIPGTNFRQSVYVPRDEDFSIDKTQGFQGDSLKGLQSTLVPMLRAKFDETPDDFDNVHQLYSLYRSGLNLLPENPQLQPSQKEREDVRKFLEDYVQENSGQRVQLEEIKYQPPQIVDEPQDHMTWMNDEEFGRQTLAGINPVVIKRATVFPPTSALSEEEYGPATALTAQHIEQYLFSNGKRMTAAEAVATKRLFTIDYHDIYMPYINKINSQKVLTKDGEEPRKCFIYAPRAFFFLTDDKKMKPVAIELSLPPPYNGENQSHKRVFTPPRFEHEHDSEWELAKLHFNSVDFGYHELISHWMKCHCVMEPFVIASHRQLSAMHPIFVLLDPCFVNTMRINANARGSLIACAPEGTIESYFTPGKYGNEMSAVVYDKLWRFDRAGLPHDLLDRGMAEHDYSAPGGVKLLFEDYPFAKDALDVWNATKEYITDYVKIFYSSDEKVREDEELQAWWKEIREVGHGDKKDEPWWPTCKTVGSLIEILCNILWIAGPQHAAVNFGQYGYCGFMLNRPPMTRRPIPEPNTAEYKRMCYDFEAYMFRVVSSPMQTLMIMTTLNVLSTHAKDEEYIGQRLEHKSNWTSNPKVLEVFQKYAQKVERLEHMFHQRNHQRKDLKNRRGALEKSGYTLMYPTSEPGVTGRGIPWSISI